MKSLFLSLTLLTALPVHHAPAQEQKINLKSTNHIVETDHGKKNKPNQEAKDQDVSKPDSLSENYQMLLEEYYKLPGKNDINFVRASDGKTYSGTKNGIKMCDGSSTILITTENSNIPENNISALALDQDDHLWIGTDSSGIVLGVGTSIKPFKTKLIQTRDPNIFSIAADEKGFVWVTFRNGGIECFRDGKSIAYFPKE